MKRNSMRAAALIVAALALPWEPAAAAPPSRSAQQYAAHEGMTGGGGIDVNPFNGTVSLRDFRVRSPEGFSERVMAYFPRITADYDVDSPRKGVQHFRSVRVELGELVLVRRKSGDFNFQALIEEKPPAGKKKKKTPFRIDTLELKIGRMIYKDYTTGREPLIVTFGIGLNATYRDVTDARIDDVTKSLGGQVIKNISIEDIKNFDIGKLPEIAASAWAAIPESTKEKLLGPAKEAAKSIDDLGKKLLKSVKAMGK